MNRVKETCDGCVMLTNGACRSRYECDGKKKDSIPLFPDCIFDPKYVIPHGCEQNDEEIESVTVRELWDAIARVDCESVCPGILIDKIRRAIYENRMFGEYKDPNFVLKIMRDVNGEER